MHNLDPQTKVELIAIKGSDVFKKIMTYKESLNIKKKKGWIYKTYQLNFSQFKIT